MSHSIRFVPAAMLVLFGLAAASIPSSTATVEIRDLLLVREVQPTATLAHGTRHHANHKNEDPGFGPIGGGAARPMPQVAL